MSESCSTFPTLTSTGQITTQSFTVSTSLSVTTLPPTTSVTFTLGPCPTPPLGVTSTCLPVTVPVTTIIPGRITQVQVPITLPVDITTQTLATLFGTSCTTINNNNNNTPTNPTPQQPPTPSPSPTFPPSPSSTPPVFTTESSSTQPNGSVVVQTVTQTASQTPNNTIASDDKGGDSPNVAPIVGGAVGGFFGLLAIVALVWFILKRRRRWDDIFDKEDDEIIATGARRADRFSLDVDVEPKPYQYGLVGQATAPSASSPPNSPPLGPSPAKGAPDLHHARTTSLTPLTAGMVTTPPLTSTTVSSRPSTTGSSSQQTLFSQQGYPFPQQQLLSANFNPTGDSMMHNYSLSSGSISPSVTPLNWTGGPGPGYNGGVIPVMMATKGMTPDEHMYGNRSGSPTSILESQVRKLQVANVDPLSPASDNFSLTDLTSSSSSAAAAAAAASSPVVQRDGKGRIRMSVGSSPLVHIDGGTAPGTSTAVAGASSSAPQPHPSGDDGTSPPAYQE